VTPSEPEATPAQEQGPRDLEIALDVEGMLADAVDDLQEHRKRIETLRFWAGFINRHTLKVPREDGFEVEAERDSDVETALNLALESACKLLDRIARRTAEEIDPREEP
jgi:hypothetical protein